MARTLKHRKSNKKNLKRKNNHRGGSKKNRRTKRKMVRKSNRKQRGGFINFLIPQDGIDLGRHMKHNASNFYNDLIGDKHSMSPSVMSQPINQKNHELINRQLVDYKDARDQAKLTTMSDLS